MNSVTIFLFFGAALPLIKFCDSAKKSPHVVFILVDDLGYNDLGYSQYSDVETPTIDKLASEGLTLNYSYTPWVCTPSRAAIMTGIYPYRYGMEGGALYGVAPYGLDLERKLLPQYMKDSGYQTHMVGKWHLGHCKDEYTPLNRGFDTFRGFLGGHIGYYDHLNGPETLDYWDNRELLFNDVYSTDDFADYTANLIRSNEKTEPMFLYLALQAVHAPLDKPPHYDDQEHPYKNKYREIFREMVRSVDNFTSVVVEALKEKDMWEDTVLILTSDNGGAPALGGNNYPLRGAKATLWEGGTRIRSFLHGRDVPKGEYLGLFHAVDWLPTIAAMAGRSIKRPIDGLDQWSAFQKKSQDLEEQPRKSFFYNVHEVVNGDGTVTTRSAVRARFENEDGKSVDYKFILGNPGSPSVRIKTDFNKFHDPDILHGSPYFPEGALYDMDVADDVLEETEVEGHAGIKRKLKNMIDEEKNGDWKAAEEPLLAAELKSSQMKDKNGQKYLGPTWC